ncbi:MAG TPA: outer membrane beta-barrel protein, partial [Gemmataceae bacterium]|nr:outer membrane beta-barrel protein [Gemmataceae bacterium]
DAVKGGTPSFGPPRSFGGGGGFGAFIPGTSLTYGLVNYTEFQLSKKDFFSFRNEWWRDEEGERSGFATNYSSHTIGLSHNFNEVLQVRPEIGWYHSYDVPAFNLGTRRNMVLYGFDMTLRF